MSKLYTSEQVSCGHPDKICDQISDAILDANLSQDINSRVAVETLIKNDTVVVAGEVTSSANIDVCAVINDALKDIGVADYPYKIVNLVDKQSPDIALGVDLGGAGDQGMMYGYACDETEQCLPLSYVLATDVLKDLRGMNHPMLRPDAKAQVTIQYNDDGSKQIHTFLVSSQHSDLVSQSEVRAIVLPVMRNVAEKYNLFNDFNVLVNPTGRFVVGGSWGDSGVTGRKIVADTYGGYARHGGGAFSGKDPTKVDRSAAYMARHIAKHLLKRFELSECEIQLSYAIGVAEPISVNVTSKRGSIRHVGDSFENYVRTNFDLTPAGIIKFLDLKNVSYYDTAKYGHFTNQQFNWERI